MTTLSAPAERHLPGLHPQKSHAGLDLADLGFDPDRFLFGVETEGTFGKLRMGLDHAGDVNIRWGSDNEIDLANYDLWDLTEKVRSLRDERDILDEDDVTDPDEVFDSLSFGSADEHQVDLYGNGVMIAEFHRNDDEWGDEPRPTLVMDPPSEADPDDPDDEDSDDVEAFLDAAQDVLDAADDEGLVEFEDESEGRHLPYLHDQDTHAGGRLGRLLDRLKLAGRIALGDDERLLASDLVRTDSAADVLLALLDTPSGRELRLGVVFGDDTDRWRAADLGGTVRFDEPGIRTVQDGLDRLGEQGRQWTADFTRRADEIDAEVDRLSRRETELLQKTIGPATGAGYARVPLPADQQAELDTIGRRLSDLADSYPEPDPTLAEGSVPAAWGDLVYRLEGVDDERGGWALRLAVRPPDPDGWEIPDDAAVLSPAELAALAAKVGQMAAR